MTLCYKCDGKGCRDVTSPMHDFLLSHASPSLASRTSPSRGVRGKNPVFNRAAIIGADDFDSASERAVEVV